MAGAGSPIRCGGISEATQGQSREPGIEREGTEGMDLMILMLGVGRIDVIVLAKIC